MNRAADSISLVDQSGTAEPVLRNSASESMDLFLKDMERNLSHPFNSAKLSKSLILDFNEDFYHLIKSKKLTFTQAVMIRSDVERQAFFNLCFSKNGRVK